MNRQKTGIVVLICLMGILALLSFNDLFIDFDKNIVEVSNWHYIDQEFVDPKIIDSDFEGRAIKMPGTLKKLTGDGFGYGTFFTRVSIPDEWIGKSIAIRKDYILCADDIYVDGEFLESTGKISVSKDNYEARYDTVILAFIPKSNEVTFVIQASNFDDRVGAFKPINIGPSAEIFKRSQIATAKEMFLFGVIIIMGMYHLGLYVRRKNDMSSLYFGLFCLMIAMRNVLLGERILIKVLRFPEWEIVSKFAYASVFLSLIFIYRFCSHVFPKYINSKYDKWISWICYVCIGIIVLAPNYIYDNTLNVFYVLLIFLFFYLLRGIVLAAINKERGATFFVFTVSFLSMTTIVDVLNQSMIINTGSLVPVGLFVFIFSQAYLLIIKSTEAFENVEKYSYEIRRMNEDLEDIVYKRTSDLSDALGSLEKRNMSIKNLVDNSNQGFLCFGMDLLIDESYGMKCKEILGEDGLGKNFFKLIYKDSNEEMDFACDVVGNIFKEDDLSKLDVYISLLDTEVQIDDKYVDVKYKIIDDMEEQFKIMVTMTDISERKLLEAEMASEKNNLTMLVKAFIYKNDLVYLLKDYKYFCRSEYLSILNDKSDFNEKIKELFRIIHTFKGNFAQFYMIGAVDNLSAFEDILEGYRLHDVNDYELEIKTLKEFDIYGFISEDMQYLIGKVGKNYFDKNDEFVVDYNEYKSLENEILQLSYMPNLVKVIPKLQRLKNQNIGDLFISYRDYIFELAKSLDKEVTFNFIQDEQIFVDTDRYVEFSRSIINIFKNILDHGIEGLDERIEKGKPPIGKIDFVIIKRSGEILIEIIDDGRGIDYGEIRKKYDVSYSDEEILDLIFEDDISSKSSVSSISGRGVGLSAVKKAVLQLGGSIKAISNKDDGTKFEIRLPYSEEEMKIIENKDFMQSIIDSISKYSLTEFGIDKIEVNDYIADENLNEISSAVLMRGSVNGLVLISGGKKLSKLMLDRLGIEEEYIDEEIIADSIGEFSNMVIGNVLRDYEERGMLMHLGNPIKFYGLEQKMFVSSYDIVAKNIMIGDSNVKVVFVENVFN